VNREVNLVERVWLDCGKNRQGRPPPGHRFCPVVYLNNGRVKRDVFLVEARPEKHPEGAYYNEWYEGARHRRISVGKNPRDAGGRRDAMRAEIPYQGFLLLLVAGYRFALVGHSLVSIEGNGPFINCPHFNRDGARRIGGRNLCVLHRFNSRLLRQTYSFAKRSFCP
jgi:hypothetical protein